MTTPKRREEGHIFRIGAVAGIIGSLLAMVGNLLHPAPLIGDPEGVAQTIAQSEIWVPVHLVIVVGLILMLGALVALSCSIEAGVAGALARSQPGTLMEVGPRLCELRGAHIPRASKIGT